MSNHDTNQPEAPVKTQTRSLKLFTAVLAVGTIIMVGLVIHKAYQLATADTHASGAHIDEMTFTKEDSAPAKHNHPSDKLLNMMGVEGGTTFKGEPADLKPIPQAKRISGVEHHGPSTTERITHWVVSDKTLEAVKAHYLNQTTEQGYELKDQTEKPELVNLRLTKDENILIIRLNQTEKNIRVLLWEIQNLLPQNR